MLAEVWMQIPDTSAGQADMLFYENTNIQRTPKHLALHKCLEIENYDNVPMFKLDLSGY